jgi:hypothetical protein
VRRERPVIVGGKPEDSQLYKLVAHLSEPGMPFKSPELPDATLTLGGGLT